MRVRVPASSANLGPGFDAFGLALGRYDVIEVSTAADGLVVEVSGQGADAVPRDGRHLVVRALRAGFARFGGEPPGLRLRCANTIPHARGLGSSAAAAVAGAVAAAALAGRDLAAEHDALLQLTAGMEGHADNAAASLLGGFVIAWSDAAPGGGNGGDADGNIRGGFHAVRLDVHPGIRPVALIASVESSTATTRGLLPKQVSLADAAFTGGRTALAVHAMTARPELLLAATEDRLHQPYRRSAYLESAELVDVLRGHGIAAAISGAGPSVLAFPPDGVLPTGVATDGFTVCPLEVDRAGATVEWA